MIDLFFLKSSQLLVVNSAMESMLSMFVITLSLVFTLIYLLKSLKPREKNLPPSPPKLPIIGNLHQLGKRPHRSLQALSAKYGPLMHLHLGTTPTLVVSSADAVKEISKADLDVKFSGRPQVRVPETFTYGCTDLAFSPYGEYWKQVRKISVLELLSQKRVQEFQFVREEEVTKMIEKIRVSSEEEVAVDLSKMFLTVSSNIVSRSALGRVLEQDGDEKSLGILARKTIDLFAAFSFKDFFPYLGWMDYLTGLVARSRNISNALDDVLDQVIEEHQVSLNEGDKSDEKDIVDILLSLQKSGTLEMDLTRDNLKAILLDMFVGGTDTTAATMEWAMAELVKNPSKMKKAQEEVRRVVGNKLKVSEADINHMSYLKCVIKETLRLHPQTMNLRETSSSVKLEGYDVPPKTTVLINTWAIQRDPKVWDRPEEFIPERFSEMPIDYIDQSGKFIPFGSGRRICPGIAFAVAEAELVVANLLCWFDWSLPHGQNAENLDLSGTTSTVVRMKTPLLVVPVMHSP